MAERARFVKKILWDKPGLKLGLTDQADLAIRNSNVDELEFVEWFVNKRMVSMGGGDVLSYLRYREDRPKPNK